MYKELSFDFSNEENSLENEIRIFGILKSPNINNVKNIGVVNMNNYTYKLNKIKNREDLIFPIFYEEVEKDSNIKYNYYLSDSKLNKWDSGLAGYFVISKKEIKLALKYKRFRTNTSSKRIKEIKIYLSKFLDKL